MTGPEDLQPASPAIETGSSTFVRLRRRRSRREDSSLLGMALRIERPVLNKLILALLGLTLVLSAILFWYERTFYPQIWMGASHEDVRYGFGTPRIGKAPDGREMWEYDINGHTEFAMFEDGRVTTAGCVEQANPCPIVLGVSTMDYEDILFANYGVPDRQSVGKGTKYMGYHGFGLDFELSRFKIEKITVHRDGRNWSSVLYRFALFLLP